MKINVDFFKRMFMPHTMFDVSCIEDDRVLVQKRLREFLCSDRSHQIATVNPEFLLETRKNSRFLDVLNACELRLPDGVGMHLWFWLQGKYMRSRISGADLVEGIFQLAEENRATVFLAVKKGGLSSFEEIKSSICLRYPNVRIVGSDMDVSLVYTPFNAYETVSSLTGASVVLCNFGAPEQEIFLSQLKGGTMRIGMGVGGSFDYLTGRIRRAPKHVRALGAEWLWRLAVQPNRWRRIIRAVIVFPFVIFFDRIKYILKTL